MRAAEVLFMLDTSLQRPTKRLLSRGISSALSGLVQLYEISGFGYHTPLSSGEVAKLFRAGRLDRDSKCKPVDAERWRTLDELFPLLNTTAPVRQASPWTKNTMLR